MLFTNNAGDLLKHAILGDYVKEKVPSLKKFMTKENADQEYNIPSLAALSSAMRLLQRCRFSLEQLIQMTLMITVILVWILLDENTVI
jgi:hypothetical protein